MLKEEGVLYKNPQFSSLSNCDAEMLKEEGVLCKNPQISSFGSDWEKACSGGLWALTDKSMNGHANDVNFRYSPCNDTVAVPLCKVEGCGTEVRDNEGTDLQDIEMLRKSIEDELKSSKAKNLSAKGGNATEGSGEEDCERTSVGVFSPFSSSDDSDGDGDDDAISCRASSYSAGEPECLAQGPQ